MNETYLYPYSVEDAKRADMLSLWRESHKTNIFCRNAIESAIRQNFDGMHLNPDCLKPVLDEYGYLTGGGKLFLRYIGQFCFHLHAF